MMHQGVKADKHCGEGIARTSCGLGEQVESAECQY